MFTVSVNPTYYCNFRCNFCYLTPAQLGDRLTTKVTTIMDRMNEISNYTKITHIDLYGGEVAILPSDYLTLLITLLKKTQLIHTDLQVIIHH